MRPRISIRGCVHPYVQLFIHRSICWSICRSVSQSVVWSIGPSVMLSWKTLTRMHLMSCIQPCSWYMRGEAGAITESNSIFKKKRWLNKAVFKAVLSRVVGQAHRGSKEAKTRGKSIAEQTDEWTDRPMDGPTDGPTDIVKYRLHSTRQKDQECHNRYWSVTVHIV